jgi:hypothetical protein
MHLIPLRVMCALHSWRISPELLENALWRWHSRATGKAKTLTSTRRKQWPRKVAV